MRKILLAAAAALLFLLPVSDGDATMLGPHDPPARDEYRFRWGEGFQSRYQRYFSGGYSDRGVFRNQGWISGEYGGYDWSFGLRVGASTFSSGGSTEWDPVPYAGARAKVLVWAPPGSPWSVGSTADFEQALPFDTGGSRPVRISGLYDARVAVTVQHRRDDRVAVYGGPLVLLSGFTYAPRFTVPDDNVLRPPVRPAGTYFKMANYAGLHGGVAWTLPGIDLAAEGQASAGGLSAAVSFRLPLDGGPAALVPRSLRELFSGWGDRPADEKDGPLEGPVRDDGPAEVPPDPNEVGR